MEVAARAEMNGLQPLTLSTSVNVEERPAEHRSDNNTEGQNLNRNSKYVEDFVPIDLPNPGYTHTQYHPSMMMPSTELLDDIGISSAEFLAIVGQIGNPDTSCSILDLGPRNETLLNLGIIQILVFSCLKR